MLRVVAGLTALLFVVLIAALILGFSLGVAAWAFNLIAP